MRPFPFEGVAAGPDNDYTVNTTICHLKSPTTSYRCQFHDFDLNPGFWDSGKTAGSLETARMRTMVGLAARKTSHGPLYHLM